MRAAVHLSTHKNERCNSQTIAAATQVPAQYISKVLKDLVVAGIVSSKRGPNGGFALARASDQISVLEVVNAVDPIQRIFTCPLGLPEHGAKLCRLHRKLDDAIALVEQALQASSIRDMTEQVGDSTTCNVQNVRLDFPRGGPPAPRSKK